MCKNTKRIFLITYTIVDMKSFFGLLCLLAVFAYTAPALAATLYIDPSTATLNRGDAKTLAIRLDTNEAEGECINAIDGVLTYDASIVPVDVSLGSSILSMWVEKPTIDKENRRITFAGGIPNGYCGRVEGDPRLTNVLFELIVRAPGLQVGGGEASNQALVQFAPETTVYLNDGLGTKLAAGTLGTTLTLSPSIGSEIVDEWREEVAADTIPPEEFSIGLFKDEFAFEGKYVIEFNTTDKQTGISRYEVIEESEKEAGLFNFGAATAPWVEARSPYVLKDQSLNSTIRVRAIDKAGNEYVASLAPQNSGTKAVWLPYVLIGAALLVVVLALLTVILTIRRRRRKLAAEVLPATSTEVLTNDLNLRKKISDVETEGAEETDK